MNHSYALLLTWFALGACPVMAAVTADEAAKLKTTLTPTGAERAANKDASIPAWDGGLTKGPSGYVSGARRPDPYPNEKPLFSITAKNMASYGDKLSEGVRLLLSKNADYRLDVYPSHRSFAAPQYIYDRTERNAVNVKLTESAAGSVFPTNYDGGYPFPIPKDGAEVMNNHLFRWQMDQVYLEARLYFVTAEGKAVLKAENNVTASYPLNLTTPAAKDAYATKVRVATVAPAIARGGAVVSLDKVDIDQRTLWTYLSGQRRVKMLPNACCDSPAPSTGGAMNFDEVDIFAGTMKLFDWKLLGKKEMYIPYNSTRFMLPTRDADVLGKAAPNPDHVRWELHRVWVVEATLKPGKRHIYPRTLYYLDEDSWAASQADRFDAQGTLAKTNMSLMFAAPDVPVTLSSVYMIFDHITGAWFINGVVNETKVHYRRELAIPDSTFNPDSLSGDSLR